MRAVYRLLLVFYPRAFRRRYEAELLDAFDGERRDHGGRGPIGVVTLWGRLSADLLSAAGRQRWRQARTFIRRRTVGDIPQLPPQPRRGLMETLGQDVRYAIRQFTRRPGFTAIAVLSFALGIGGNSLIFGLLDGFVFHPFAYPESDRLVSIGATFPKLSDETTYVEALSTPEYLDIKSSRSFSHIGAFDLGNRNLSGGDVPERVFTALLLDDLFPVLGMRPHLGRGFTLAELAPKGPDVAIISHRLWVSRFGADPNIINRPVRIAGRASTIVGVMPKDLVLIGADLWIPWAGPLDGMPRDARQFTILARLAPGVSLTTANAELSALAARVHTAEGGKFKEYEGWRLTATPWAAALLQDLRPAAFVLLGAVGFVLLIACANLANLLLARSSTRHRELAVKLALGAGRWRIARQLLTESLLLAMAGSVVGLALAEAGLRFAGALIPSQFASLGLEATVNARVLAFSAVAATLSALLVTILPALQATRTDPHDSLKSDGRGGASRASARVRQGLIVAEVAFSVVLLLGAGLLLRSFLKMQAADLGFNPAGVLTMRLTLPQQKYPDNRTITSFFERLVERVQALPGVTAVGMASQYPPMGMFSNQIEIEGFSAGSTLPTANTTVASRAFFKAIQLPLVKGRTFGVEEVPGSPGRVVVNQTFVSRYLAGREPVGSRLRIVNRNGSGDWSEIIGVVGDARNGGTAAPVRPEVFIPMERGQHGWNQLFLLVRSTQDASALTQAVRSAVAAIDAEQPVYAIQTMEEAVALTSFQQRISATLVGIFATVALLLAAIGIYGVMSYSVAARTQEIGVRMAIGAERSDVIRLVLLQVARLSIAGLVIGIALLLAAGKAISQLLYGVTPADPITIAVVSAILGGVAFVAAWVPAWRASRVSPVNALRYE